jgi:hypothetical protein
MEVWKYRPDKAKDCSLGRYLIYGKPKRNQTHPNCPSGEIIEKQEEVISIQGRIRNLIGQITNLEQELKEKSA